MRKFKMFYFILPHLHSFPLKLLHSLKIASHKLSAASLFPSFYTAKSPLQLSVRSTSAFLLYMNFPLDAPYNAFCHEWLAFIYSPLPSCFQPHGLTITGRNGGNHLVCGVLSISINYFQLINARNSRTGSELNRNEALYAFVMLRQ